RAWGAESGRALTWGASHAPTVPAAWRLLAGPPKLLTTGSASARRTLASGRDADWSPDWAPDWAPDWGDETDEAGEVAEQRFAIASEMAPRLLRGLAAREGRIPVWWPDLATQLDHLVGALAASLATSDPAILEEFDEWLTALMRARCDVEAVSPLTSLVWAALAETLAEGHPEAHAALRRAGLVATAGT
ncbi:hypothetical protein, partial [Nocardioides sp.]|uniref:hypothetical protein n=1 Tax=Nocardioides sp. TaxID=35761 RepID=UPI002B27797D